MKSHIARTIAGAFMIFISRGAFAVCPSVSIDIPDIPAVCLGETIEVAPVLDEIPGDCNGMVTYPYKRWWWSVAGVGIVASNNSLPARFTPLSSGEGTIRFDLICRSRQCPDCNQNFSAERKFNVVHVGIAQSNCMVCWKETAAYLSVDPDTHAPDGVRWTSRPHGIYGEGNSVEFDPSRLTSHRYTVTAKNDGHPNCSDVCEVHVVKVAMSESERFLSAEDSEATLSLSSDSYSPGGYVWSSEPAGISSNGPNASIVFVPSNLPPGKYVVRCSSADFSDCYDECEVYILKFELVPDWNHDRKIDDQDREQATAANPFRFWVNDDRDEGDVASGNSDVPGQSNGNAKDDKVNGRCDLLDFFPVWLDLGQALALLPPGDAIQYKLKQANDAIKAVYTDLDNDRAGKYLIEDGNMYGPLFNQDSFAANVFEVTSAGVVLDNHFLQEIHANTNKGVLMFEGKLATANPVVLEISKNNLTIYRKELPISLSSVEDMYRWINLRPGQAGNSRTGPPANNPDSLSNSTNVFFLHGFNVDANAAQGWNAEMYKRLYQAGSRAKFWGMTWEGDLGLINELHYQDDVANALTVSSNFNAQVHGITGDKIVLGHSLGNMVVSGAIQDYGLSVSKYFMLNAAVATESYRSASFNDATAGNYMLHEDWVGYNSNTWCSTWYRLFSSSDDRAKLTWRNRFPSVVSVAYNFYSLGDEIFEVYAGTPTAFAGGIIPFHLERYAWQKQEVFKGRVVLGGTSWAGWGFAGHLEDHIWVPEYTMAQANAATDDNLRTNAVFRHYPTAMFAENITSSVVNDIIAQGVSALSYAAGGNPINILGLYNYNLDGIANKPNGWGRRGGAYGTRWLHSDLKDMAYLYTFKLFDELVTQGDLQ